jgi:phosphate uptake regulator
LGFSTPKEFLGYRIVANSLKSIADNAVNITDNIMALNKLIENQTLYLRELIDEELYSQILDFNSLAQQSLEESLKAMFQRNYEHADKIVSQLESFTKLEHDLVNLMLSKKLDPNVSSIFRLVIDGSRQVVEHGRTIAEVTLNRTVEEKCSMQGYQ